MTRKSSDRERLLGRRKAFQQDLLAWYRRARRPLPWRQQPSAYRTVVSEFMLQQTQVTTVLPYFDRWMEAFPSFEALAQAPAERVLRLWEGLGYYRRARNLHRLAQAVAGGPLPPTAAAWRELPGIGPYTAAAIASIALHEPVACVDGNVVRILTRLTRDATPYRDSASASKALAPLAQELVNPEHPGDHNQAMMELGATVCTRRQPACLACPVRPHCAAGLAADAAGYPRLAAKAIEHRTVIRVWAEAAGALLLHRNPAQARRLAGLHELPTAEQAGLDPAAAARGPLLAKQARGITRYRIEESIHAAEVPADIALPGLVWVPLAQLASLALSGPHRRWTTQVLERRQG